MHVVTGLPALTVLVLGQGVLVALRKLCSLALNMHLLLVAC